jgi:hypothetical protein
MTYDAVRSPRFGIPAVALLLLANACQTDVAGLRPADQAASVSQSGGSGSAQYALALTGDLNSLTGGGGGTVYASMSRTNPFQNLTLKAVHITIGNGSSGPSGDIANCQAKASALPYAADWAGNAGDWTGTLTINGTSYVKFSGTRVVAGATEQVQFTVNYGASVTTDPETGVATLTYQDAPLFFGSASTHVDMGHYRCVDVVATAAP